MGSLGVVCTDVSIINASRRALDYCANKVTWTIDGVRSALSPVERCSLHRVYSVLLWNSQGLASKCKRPYIYSLFSSNNVTCNTDFAEHLHNISCVALSIPRLSSVPRTIPHPLLCNGRCLVYLCIAREVLRRGRVRLFPIFAALLRSLTILAARECGQIKMFVYISSMT